MSDHDRLLASVALAQYRKCGHWDKNEYCEPVWRCQRPATYGRPLCLDGFCDGHADSRMSYKDMVEIPEAKHIRWLERKATGG